MVGTCVGVGDGEGLGIGVGGPAVGVGGRVVGVGMPNVAGATSEVMPKAKNHSTEPTAPITIAVTDGRLGLLRITDMRNQIKPQANVPKMATKRIQNTTLTTMGLQ